MMFIKATSLNHFTTSNNFREVYNQHVLETGWRLQFQINFDQVSRLMRHREQRCKLPVFTQLCAGKQSNYWMSGLAILRSFEKGTFHENLAHVCIKPLKSFTVCNKSWIVWILSSKRVPQHLWPSGYFPSSKATRRSWRWSFHCTPVIGSMFEVYRNTCQGHCWTTYCFCGKSAWSFNFKVEMKRHQWMILKLFHIFQWDDVLISLFKSSNLCGRRWEESDAEAFLRMFKNFEAFGLSTNVAQTRTHENKDWKKNMLQLLIPNKNRIMHNSWICLVTPNILKTGNPRKTMRFIKNQHRNRKVPHEHVLLTFLTLMCSTFNFYFTSMSTFGYSVYTCGAFNGFTGMGSFSMKLILLSSSFFLSSAAPPHFAFCSFGAWHTWSGWYFELWDHQGFFPCSNAFNRFQQVLFHQVTQSNLPFCIGGPSPSRTP